MWTVFCRETASQAGAFASENVAVGVVITRSGGLESLIKMRSNNAAERERARDEIEEICGERKVDGISVCVKGA
jgi:hypothetical protein